MNKYRLTVNSFPQFLKRLSKNAFQSYSNRFMVYVWPKRVKTQFASLALRRVLFLLQDIRFRSPSMRGRQNFETVPLDFFLSLSLSTAVLFRFSCPVLFFFRWTFTTLASFRWENVSEILFRP